MHKTGLVENKATASYELSNSDFRFQRCSCDVEPHLATHNGCNACVSPDENLHCVIVAILNYIWQNTMIAMPAVLMMLNE